MKKGKALALASVVLAMMVSACGQKPIKPADTHIRAEEPRAEGAIPPPVQLTPMLPQPKPAARPETYSVVVNNVRAQELLFALARDARLNVDIHSDITGTVTLNAIDQTLPQLLTRIARQIDMRWEIEGQNLVVMRDTPFLRVYRVDYVNMARDARSVAVVATQVSGTQQPGQTTTTGPQNNSTATINSVSANKFWDTLVANIKEILQETDKVLPAGSSAAPPVPSTTAPAPQPGAPAGAPPSALPVPVATFREAASVIANPETGVLNIRATSRQHEKVQEFLDQVLTNAKRQVLIEATVAEVQLNNEYQRGIDWQRLRTNAASVGVPSFGTGNSGLEFLQSSAGTPASINTNAFVFGGAITSLNFNFALRLLESFGDVRVLSSPKISVLNNQTAVLKVVDNLVYFTVQAQTTQNQTSSLTTFTTTLNSVPVGFIMSLVPQISDSDSVVLNLRPTISRKIGDVADPNPSLKQAGVTSLIPVIQTREMESVLRVQSGHVAVLGGLMQDARSNVEDTIPGINQIPGLGQLLEQRKDQNQKTELVIFLRPVVIRDANIDGDYSAYRGLLPGADFFSKPNPSRPARTEGPFN
ncbi:MAG TPA: pilus (MSHA type) biogenesis protein MshL [Burkholderiales bacterium]|nr:pilus (MSHA type) biogenesis protein MshL [Burkholderiales bacterium]